MSQRPGDHRPRFLILSCWDLWGEHPGPPQGVPSDSTLPYMRTHPAEGAQVLWLLLLAEGACGEPLRSVMVSPRSMSGSPMSPGQESCVSSG